MTQVRITPGGFVGLAALTIALFGRFEGFETRVAALEIRP